MTRLTSEDKKEILNAVNKPIASATVSAKEYNKMKPPDKSRPVRETTTAEITSKGKTVTVEVDEVQFQILKHLAGLENKTYWLLVLTIANSFFMLSLVIALVLKGN